MKILNCLTIPLCLVALAGLTGAQDPATTFTAKCDGGKAPLAHAALAVRITSREVVFTQGAKRFAVPVSHLTFVAYSDPADESYFAGMQWNEPAGDVVLTIQKQDYHKVVAALKNAYEQAATDRAAKNPT